MTYIDTRYSINGNKWTNKATYEAYSWLTTTDEVVLFGAKTCIHPCELKEFWIETFTGIVDLDVKDINFTQIYRNL